MPGNSLCHRHTLKYTILINTILIVSLPIYLKIGFNVSFVNLHIELTCCICILLSVKVLSNVHSTYTS